MKKPVQYVTALFSIGVISLSVISLPAYAEKTIVISPSMKAQEKANMEKEMANMEKEMANKNSKIADAEMTEAEMAELEGEEEQEVLPPPKPKKTLIMTQKPSETALSVANKELLSENNKLERKISELQTQVNVLVNERGGQLFLYGALTALISFFIGGFVSWFFLARGRSRW